MEYTFSSGAKKFILTLIVGGVVLLGLGLALDAHYEYSEETIT